MNETQFHRGPDEGEIYREPGVGFGHRRLSIIDVASGQQPLFNEDRSVVVVFNGEIYNFQELVPELQAAGHVFRTHSDTEVIVHGWEQWGEGVVQRLRGMFAFAVWDRQTRTLSLARDRLGVKPLVYAETGAGFAFASEIATLFQVQPDLSRAPDYAAMDHYLTFQYIPAPLSGFRAIRKLPPAHAMIVHEGKVERVWRYWDIDHTLRSRLSFAEACEALREQVLEATRIRLVSDVPLGAFLSGGVDSSITVAAMARLARDPVKTYAIGFDDERFNELPYAREVARHLGTEHHEMTVRPRRWTSCRSWSSIWASPWPTIP